MLRLFLLMGGGGIGTVLRYGLSNMAYRSSSGIFPTGTLAVNLGGSFAIGCFWALFERTALTPNARLFLMTGVLGGFTTFSTFTLENFSLLRNGEFKIAAANVLLSNLAGIFLVFAGFKGAELALKGLK